MGSAFPGLIDGEMRSEPVNAFFVTHQQNTQLIMAFFNFITHQTFDGLFLPVFSCQLVHGQDGVVTWMIGIMYCRAIDDFAVFPDGQVIGNRDRFGNA